MDNKEIHKNSIELLDCQVVLVLKSLEFYLNSFRNFCISNNKDVENEIELQISIISNTYNQILEDCKDGLENSAINSYNKIIKKTA